MRIACVAAAAAAILVGCGKKSETTTAAETANAPAPAETVSRPGPSLPKGFPAQTASWRGTYEFRRDDAVAETIIHGSGRRQRMTFPAGSGFGPGRAGRFAQTMAIDPDKGAFVVWPEGEGAPAIATRIETADLGPLAAIVTADEAKTARAVRAGEDRIAGERCDEWSFPSEEDGAGSSVCVTSDGILLRASAGGVPIFTATSIARGPQDPSLFAPPAGYEVVDMGECMALAGDMMAAMKSGAKPDMSKMKKCQELGEKMAEAFGE